MLSRVLLASLAAVAAGLLWIEHEHRIVLASPAAAELAPVPQAACPENDSVPFDAACIAYIEGGAVPNARKRAAAIAPPIDAARPEPAAACPQSNENAPYSADCIKYLSGWFWQANPRD